MKTPTTLIIMDGFGLANASAGNAISQASTPVLDSLFASCPNTMLSASGQDVGLPEGQIGNSEVGHTNIGAGRVVFQDLPRINNSIDDGSFFENKVYVAAMDACKDGHALHIMGLLSDGGVHSHTKHLWAFLEMAKKRGVENVYIHCFLDGRDVPPTSGMSYVEKCVEKCAEFGVGKIATVSGRFYAMDRDSRWDRLEKAYRALVCGEGVEEADPVLAVSKSYDVGLTDEFMLPTVCDKNGTIKAGDSVIFINFRPDRARELTRALVDPAFNGFVRPNGCFQLHYVCTTQYDISIPNVTVAFPPETLNNTFGEFISKLGMTQLRIAETEKYAHVTFFFNGGREQSYPGEDRVLIPSPTEQPTYDLIPEMSAYSVTEEACKRILSGQYDVIVINFANCDMVGHTGVIESTIKAVETVDTCVGRVIDATSEMGGITFVTADHGNADQMLEDDGVTPHTAHTTNLVPLIIKGVDAKLHMGKLCDIIPTMLDLMGLEKPEEMNGKSLLI